MNNAAAPVPPVSPVPQDSSTNGSDSEANAGEYYRPISGNDSSDTDSDSDELNANISNHSHSHSNGYIRQAEEEEKEEDSDDADEEEEEERMREASYSAIVREHEDRRRAPLTPENATRVMEAMRRISFPGMTPEWANRVPENRWVDLLRQRASHQNSSATTSSSSI